MSDTILVTGPAVHPAAVRLAHDRGYALAFTPAYPDSALLQDRLRQTGAVAILSRMGVLDAAAIGSSGALRVISKHGAGVDNIDLAAAAARGIPVLSSPGANAVSVAEHALALMLAVTKRIGPLDAGLRAGRWDKPGFAGREIAGLRIGLVGLGAIAQALVPMARGLGLIVQAHDPHADPALFDRLEVMRHADLDSLLAGSDIVSLHCPLTDATRGVLNARSLAVLPQGAVIINTARGGLIDDPALLDAVRSGHLSGAGLDSFAQEPPPADHPFLSEPAIVMTPHIGGVTAEANARVGVEAIRIAIDLLEGRAVPPARIANRHLLDGSDAVRQQETA
ncbi:hydroxyacid dehydrogenase [Paracoccus nototheniae]|uniref:Hydroxyacid dehydrogenase n=1 Tax=Paracoccus nototheniae TaxID=2489002 RepID=A0ABW4DSS2_9RHOB|nr:hydroxyacid dehydrogenase [Paracoccus nototheniae]